LFAQALINGTLKEDDFCPECGERGHRQFECPQRIKSFKNAGVKCSICGDMSHPTRDCPLKERGVTSEAVLDSEYDSLMSELGGKVKAKEASTIITSSVAAVAPKKQQTVIHMSEIMTGQVAPTPTPATLVQPPPSTAAYGWPGVPPPAFGYPAPPYAPFVPAVGVPGMPTPPVMPLPPLFVPAVGATVPAIPVPPTTTSSETSQQRQPAQSQYAELNEMD
jgi:splicing factor 1